MNWSTLKENIESIIGCSIQEHTISLAEWKAFQSVEQAAFDQSIEDLNIKADQQEVSLLKKAWIPVKKDLSTITVWEIQSVVSSLSVQSHLDQDDEERVIHSSRVLDSSTILDSSTYADSTSIENELKLTKKEIKLTKKEIKLTDKEMKSTKDEKRLATELKSPEELKSKQTLNTRLDSSQNSGQASDSKEILDKVESLLKLLLPAVTGFAPLEEDHSSLSMREQGIQELGNWIVQQIGEGQLESTVPDGYLLKERLHVSMIPFLLVADSVQTGVLESKELEKLLHSYFGGEVLLLPLLENEWLILTNRELIEDSSDLKQSNIRDLDTETEDTEEDVLMEFSLGLYELIASEWVGIFHIGVSKPILPTEMLLQEVALLKETVLLGRLFHVKDHIHLPWELYLERLLYRIPEGDRKDFVARADRYSDVLEDEETVATLETFFKMDCNVSETAKQLYIHRNTLLYRLDKIKQETELDVRRFEDAVLMKLTLLLYKVTKS